MNSKRPPVANSATAATSARNHVSISINPSLAEVSTYFDHVMPGQHDPQKYESMVLEEKHNKAHSCIITVAEMENVLEQFALIKGPRYNHGDGAWML